MVENQVMHGFKSLRIEGSIFPTDYLQTIAELKAPGQDAIDYGLTDARSITDAVDQYWQSARSGFDDMPMSVGEQCYEWLEKALLGRILGYKDLSTAGNVTHENRNFKLTHLALNGSVPFLLVPNVVNLDKVDSEYSYHDEGRQSPHGLIQEYLNAREDCLWGIVSNGSKLRLLRDNASITRPSYIEADIERMLVDNLYPDFRLLWLVAHASRLEPKDGRVSKCIIEAWRDKAHEIGVRALKDLRTGVQEALKELGTGFLEHKKNVDLRDSLKSQISSEQYLQELLKLIYQLLFLLTTEEQDLLHTPNATEKERRLYANGYSVNRLRVKSWKRRYFDQHADLWIGLRVVLKALSKGAPDLGLPGLGGLFQEESNLLQKFSIANSRLLAAIRCLCFFRKGDIFHRVDYQNMNTEELGSIYESLLELVPEITTGVTPNGWKFDFIGGDDSNNSTGNERRLSGSYYTPPSLVSELIKSTLEPVLEKTIKNSDDPRQDLLGIKVIDPACGSGHFLLAAARRIADEILLLENTDSFDKSSRKHALREVIQNCIFGVDKNPFAVELCKVSLWIEAVEPGKPLTFLNSHIRHGDSLIGILNPEVLESGIPAKAYDRVIGDDREICNAFKKIARKKITNVLQEDIFTKHEVYSNIFDLVKALDNMPEDTLMHLHNKQEQWDGFLENNHRLVELLRANLFVGAFFCEKTNKNKDLVPVTQDIVAASKSSVRSGINEYVKQLSSANNFFHWYIEFPDIMKKGGFDVVLGNPPWEKVELQEKEFFSSKNSEITGARNQAERGELIKKLNSNETQHYRIAKRNSKVASNYFRNSGRFPFTGVGNINTYALFAELCYNLVSPGGRVGIIVPTGIATDDTTKKFFNEMIFSKRMVSLYDFENQKFFPDIHRSLKFCLLTISGKKALSDKFGFAFYLHKVDELNEPGRSFTLSTEDFSLFNPNTLTCPVFRSSQEMAINKKIYKNIGHVLLNDNGKDTADSNPWGMTFLPRFNMSSDSGLFKTKDELENDGYKLQGNVFVKARDCFLPLYEAKLFHQYDHRYATFEGVDETSKPRATTFEEKKDYNNVIIPRYWVNEDEVLRKYPPPPIITRYSKHSIIAWRVISSATNSRTAICAVISSCGLGHSGAIITFNNT